MSKKCKSIIILLLGCMSYHSASAQNIDSLLASKANDSDKALAIGVYVFKMVEHDPKGAMLLARKGLAMSLNTPGKVGYAQCLNAIGWAYFRSGKDDSAKIYISKAITDFHEQHSIKAEARTLMNLGNIYQNEQKYDSALVDLLQAMRLIKSSDEIEYALAVKMIGIIYKSQGDLIKAKQYLEMASATFLKLNELKYFADAFGSLGLVYIALADNNPSYLDSAAYRCHTALNIYRNLKDMNGIAYSCEDLGSIFYSKSADKDGVMLDSSLYFYQQAYNIFCEMKDTLNMAYERSTISQVLIQKKQYPLAQKYLTESLPILMSKHQTNSIYANLLLLSSLYHKMHKDKEAYEYLTQAGLYNDTINKQNKDNAIADMLAKYETDKKDRIIAHNLYKTRVIEVSSIALIILSAAFAFILFNRYRIKQKLLELELRNRISNDLHDDVGSSLSSILLLSNIAVGENVHKPELINKISENAREAIERISDIIWTTNPKYDDGENLRSKIINYIAPLCQMHNIASNVSISETIRGIKFPMETRKNIFLIIKEALNNVFKHSGANEISLNLIIEEKKLVIEITDNGKGFDVNNSVRGNGMKTMMSRTKALNGEILLDSRSGTGTKILVTVPISKISSLKHD